MAFGFGDWSGKPGVLDTLSPACIELHDSYWVEGADNKAYPTWHRPALFIPKRVKVAFLVMNTVMIPVKHHNGCLNIQGDGPAFGYAMEQLDGHRHEDHFGHKVTVTRFRAAIGNTANSNEAMYDAGFDCDFISKIHQGAHSEDALSNHLT